MTCRIPLEGFWGASGDAGGVWWKGLSTLPHPHCESDFFPTLPTFFFPVLSRRV